MLVNYPFSLTDLHQNRTSLRPLQIRACLLYTSYSVLFLVYWHYLCFAARNFEAPAHRCLGNFKAKLHYLVQCLLLNFSVRLSNELHFFYESKNVKASIKFVCINKTDLKYEVFMCIHAFLLFYVLCIGGVKGQNLRVQRTEILLRLF